MTSISALIDFLMGLMSDDDTKRAFKDNPDAAMADKGLHNVSAQDVRDARLIMADNGSARPRNDGDHQSRGYHDGGLASNDPVREIVHTTNTFEVNTDVHQNVFNIDNHRTTIFDSFNSADTVTAIQDNDTLVDVDLDDDDENENTGTDKDTEKTGEDETLVPDRNEDGGGFPDTRDTDQDHAPDALAPDAPAAEEPAQDVPADPAPPAEEPPADDAGIDPGDGTGDGTDAFPTEPEPEPVQDDAPAFEADDELAVG
jgi:hypothetical protein